MAKKLLLHNEHIPGINTLDVYRKNGGYASVEKALKTMTPDEVTEEVKNISGYLNMTVYVLDVMACIL